MKIGISGHQERPGIDWAWTRHVLGKVLQGLGPKITGYSSLARGADQLFAYLVLEGHGTLVFVRPLADYEACFEGKALADFLELRRAAAHEIKVAPLGDKESAFLVAGQRVADESEILVAIWDGEDAEGKGGTGDIVAYALQRQIPVLHIDAIEKRLRWIGTPPTRSGLDLNSID